MDHTLSSDTSSSTTFRRDAHNVLPVYVISLAQDYETRFVQLQKKLHEAARECSSLTVDMKRIEAVNGRLLTAQQKAGYCDDAFFRWFITSGMLGCAASHYETWKVHARDTREDVDWALVLEDDVVFPPHLFEQLNQHILDTKRAVCDDRYDIILVGSAGADTHRHVNRGEASWLP
ncbi:hypothetical protein EBU99_14660, partial [bacterium]|nr:hypothetical protein [bacterium]